MPDSYQTEPRNWNDDLSALIDNASELESYSVRYRLSEFSRAAAESQDSAFLNAVRIEGNVFVTFENRNSFDHSVASLSSLLNTSDLDYIRERAATTTNKHAKARYLHAIASITRRHDDGQIAARSYIEAIQRYHQNFQSNAAEGFHALLDLIPIGYVVARRYGLADEFKAAVVDFLLDDIEMAVHVKSKIFIRAIDESWLTREEAARLRDVSLGMPEAVSGGDDGEITAVAAAGMRLADRLGESRRPWQAAEARALEAKLVYNPHPILAEVVGTKLLRLYQLLGDDDKRQGVISRMGEAREHAEYQTFSFKPEGLDLAIKEWQEKAGAMVAEHGPLWVLVWLSANRELLPSITRLKVHMDEMAAKGIGLFRQFATTIISGNERLLAREGVGNGTSNQEFNEQYGIFWQFTSVLPFEIFMTELIRSGEVRPEHFEELLSESWMGREEDVAYGGGATMPNDLVELLMINLRSYCALLKGEVPSESLVLILDSLVLKFEAVLRKLARLLGVPHLKATTGQQRPLTEVAGLELLDGERIVEICGDDLIAYAKYTLDREPEGLRDRIGHAILHRAEYKLADLQAVVQLVLRFAALQLPKTDKEQGSSTLAGGSAAT